MEPQYKPIQKNEKATKTAFPISGETQGRYVSLSNQFTAKYR